MARPTVYFDKEVGSGVPIEWGRHRFLNDKRAHIPCMAWSLNNLPTKLWLPGMPVPTPFLQPKNYTFKAFNIQFDQLSCNTVGQKYGFGRMPLDNCVDVMAIAARYGLPQSLDKLGKALGVNLGKMKEGKALVKLFCQPPFKNPKKDDAWHAKQFRKFCEYCMRDVDSMKEILRKLPSPELTPDEQHIWQVTATINKRGVPIDHPAVVRINQVIDHFRSVESKKVPKITDGEVQTVGQIEAIVAWCSEQGVELPNLQVQTVEGAVEMLEEQGVPHGTPKHSVLQLLKLRMVLGGAAVKKFVRLLNMTHEGRIHDNLRYHGASTGRPTGGGFQMLNLPRATLDEVKDEDYDDTVQNVIQSFYDTTVLKDPRIMHLAKCLVRPMMKAKDNHMIMAADWSSIEYIILMWFAGETDKVERFRAGFDPYQDFAATLFGIPYEEVTKEKRNYAKPPVLGSGYMLSWGGLIGYAEGYGVDMTEEEAKFATGTYRSDHARVKRAWYALKNMAHQAVMNHMIPFRTHKTEFKVIYDGQGWHWLKMTLPSGRALYYCQPQLADGKFGPVIKHRGVDPDTKQWVWVYLKPQRIIENIIQALGRDILNDGVDRLVKNGFTPIVHVYDEIVMEEPEVSVKERYDLACRLMCVPPKWAPDLPLFAEGYVAKRYRKG